MASLGRGGELRKALADVRAAGGFMARAESPAVGLEDEHLHAVVTLGVRQAPIHVPDHCGVLRVRLLRPVQDNACDGAVLLVDHRVQLLPIHEISSRSRNSDLGAPSARSHRTPRFSGAMSQSRPRSSVAWTT